MNISKQKIPNKARSRAYTYYIVSFKYGGTKWYVTKQWGELGSEANAFRYKRKSDALFIMRTIRKAGQQPYSLLNSKRKTILMDGSPSIVKKRGISKEETRIMELIDL